MQHHAGARRDKAGAETVEDRVDEADGIAVAVDDGDIDRVAVQRHFEDRQVGAGLTQVDHAGQPVGKGIGEQFLDGTSAFSGSAIQASRAA